MSGSVLWKGGYQKWQGFETWLKPDMFDSHGPANRSEAIATEGTEGEERRRREKSSISSPSLNIGY